jgi:transcriptional regulator with XRE-family HTH domain
MAKTRKRKLNPWDRAFGRRLKVAREASHLTQQAMADALKLKVDTYQKYEAGKRSFPKDLIIEVVKCTNYGPWFLLTGQPDHTCPANKGYETGSFRTLEPVE